jgi:flagellar M-ring protein FliF
MAQAPATGLATLARGFTQLSNTQKLGFLAALAALVAVVAVSLMWARTPEYRVLYSNLSDRDGGEVIAALAAANVPYKVEQGGSVILVPSDQVYDLRLKLAAQGLPKGGAVGFELMDAQKFGTSQFAEQVNYQRALAGELARSIQSVAAVQNARVHLAIPRPSVFVREQQQPSASVFVAMYPGRLLDANQVSAIQHLVASSVPELVARNVTVVDQAGNLLSGAPAEPGRGMDAAQLKYAHALESGYANRIETILRPLLGPDNVRAQVTAALDFTQAEQTSETFKPNQVPQSASVRSQQTVETLNTGEAGASGIPGALSNQPPGAASAPITAPASRANAPGAQPAAQPPTSTHRENILNYEVDKTVRHVREEVGVVKRLSAAVVVNYRREVDAAGKPAYKALPEAELKQIDALVREAMGFSAQRGDTLNVVNAPFNADVLPQGEAAPSQWGRLVEDLTSPAGVMNLVKYLVAGFVVLVALGMARSAVRDIARAGRVEPTAALPGGPIEPQLGAPGAAAGAARYAANANPAGAMEADLRAVKELAKQEPRVVANVVKTWVAAGE